MMPFVPQFLKNPEKRKVTFTSSEQCLVLVADISICNVWGLYTLSSLSSIICHFVMCVATETHAGVYGSGFNVKWKNKQQPQRTNSDGAIFHTAKGHIQESGEQRSFQGYIQRSMLVWPSQDQWTTTHTHLTGGAHTKPQKMPGLHWQISLEGPIAPPLLRGGLCQATTQGSKQGIYRTLQGRGTYSWQERP